MGTSWLLWEQEVSAVSEATPQSLPVQRSCPSSSDPISGGELKLSEAVTMWSLHVHLVTPNPGFPRCTRIGSGATPEHDMGRGWWA